MNKYQQMAFDILREISEKKDALESVNEAAAKIFDKDFPPNICLMPDSLETKVVELIGEILEPGAGNDNIAAYWLYEGGGRIEFKDGRVFDIKSLDDVAVYVRAEK